MTKNPPEIRNEENQEIKEYQDFVKSAVADGSYFKDAQEWYFFRYLKPVCDRTLLIFGSILSVFVVYFLFGMVNDSFPLVEKKPIIIAAKDQSNAFPYLVPLKPKEEQANYDRNISTIDEAVAKYLIQFYVKERESFDFSSGSIDVVNKKFTRIKNLSTLEEYRAFQVFMNKDNPNSPIQYFGKNVKRIVNIDSVRFVQKNVGDDFKAKAKNFLTIKIPTDVEVRFSVITRYAKSEYENEDVREKFLAKINFFFEGINAESKENLNFVIKEYKLFRVK